MEIFLIFPVHLFKNIDKLVNKNVFLIEDPKYFTDFKYHKLKLAYHRSTMKAYYEYLIKNNIKVEYIDFYNINDKFYNSLINKNKKFICIIHVIKF